MVQSATSTGRIDRMAATSSRLTSVVRRLTAERGLNGFTIEEACLEAGVSRRTFFNYFPSKEEAVVGIDESEDARRLGEEFLARGSQGWAAVIEDLTGLIVEHFIAMGVGAKEHSDLVVAIRREPRLMARFAEISHEREQQLADVIAEREDTSTDDPHVLAAVQAIAVVLRMSSVYLHDPEAVVNFGAVVADSLATLRTVLAPPRSESKDSL